MKQRLKPCARKQPEHTRCVTACLLKNEPASRGRRRGLAGGEPQRKRVRTGRLPVAGRGREPTGVEKPGDDPGVGVKGQSNPEISRSPRTSFRASPRGCPPAVEPPDPLGGLAACRREPNSERRRVNPRSQDARAKPRAREGNSPDRPPRPQIHGRVAKDVPPRRQPGRWPRSSHPSKECVTAHWPSGGAPTIHGAKP